MTHLNPKPMITIGGRPFLWHILNLYSSLGINEFIICCGYKGYVIKECFANYFLHMSDITFDIEGNQMEAHLKKAEPWRVTLVDTGDTTQTGGRLKRLVELARQALGNSLVTYEDIKGSFHEASPLSLDTAKVRGLLGFNPRGSFQELIRRTIAWYREIRQGKSARELCEREILENKGLRRVA